RGREKELSDIANKRKGLLSGTGYRRDDTFIEGEGRKLENQDFVINKLEKTLHETASILRSILANDKETALRQIEAIEESGNPTHEQLLAAQQARSFIESKERGISEERSNSLVMDLFKFANLNSLMGSVRGTLTSSSSTEALKRAADASIELGTGIADMFAKGVGS